MGFSVVGASGVMFVALMIAVSGVFIQLNNTLNNIADESEKRYERIIEQGHTGFSIRYSLYNRTNSTIILELENTGSNVLETQNLNILVGGELFPDTNISFEVNGNNGNMWPPGEHLTIQLKQDRLPFYDSIPERVGAKIQAGWPTPVSLSTNGYYTYVADDGDVKIYDYRDNLIKTVSEGISEARYVSSTLNYTYAVDDHESVLRFDSIGEDLTTLITSGSELVSPRALSVTETNEVNYIYILDNNENISRYDLDGNYVDTPIIGLNSSDIYVTDHIYIVNNTSDTIDHYDLDGTNFTTMIDHMELTNPTNITVSDRYIYIIDNREHIDVFTLDGSHVDTIYDELGDELAGIDVAGGIQVGNGANGWFRLRLGLNIKVVAENGISAYVTM
ncbi:MAG: hypothetical protein R6U17_09705 [Thermoplasmata archaeon]